MKTTYYKNQNKTVIKQATYNRSELKQRKINVWGTPMGVKNVFIIFLQYPTGGRSNNGFFI